MRLMKNLSSLSLACALIGTSALASPVYPGTVQNHLNLTQSPQCTLCHATNAGGAGTVAKPFGQALQALGLSGGSDVMKLQETLDTLATNGTDSDGDGVGDIDELKAGKNPNVADAAPADGGTGEVPDAGDPPLPPRVIPEPSYGCTTVGGGLVGLLVAMLSFWFFAARKKLPRAP